MVAITKKLMKIRPDRTEAGRPKTDLTAISVEYWIPALLDGTTTITPKVPMRYASNTRSGPQRKKSLAAFGCFVSAPMLSGTSIPSKASMMTPYRTIFCFWEPKVLLVSETWGEWPLSSHTTPARPTMKMLIPYSKITHLAIFIIHLRGNVENRPTKSRIESTMMPCCHGAVNQFA